MDPSALHRFLRGPWRLFTRANRPFVGGQRRERLTVEFIHELAKALGPGRLEEAEAESLLDRFLEANRPSRLPGRRAELARRFLRDVVRTERSVESRELEQRDAQDTVNSWIFPPAEAQVERHRWSTNHATDEGHDTSAYALSLASSPMAVSGDIVAFRRTESGLAFVIGDVAGHGIGALPIVPIVYDWFQACHESWAANPAEALPGFLHALNQHLITGLPIPVGMFAAVRVGMLEMPTCTLTTAHAGFDEYRIIRAATGTVEVRRSPDRSAALGFFDSELLDHSGMPYVSASDTLEQGDIVLLATDGTEDAAWDCTPSYSSDELSELAKVARAQHQAHGEVAWSHAYTGGTVEEESAEHGELRWESQHGNDPRVFESFGVRRMDAILEAVARSETVGLHRYRAPDGDQEPVFDFTRTPLTPRSVVLALAACELVFRLAPSDRETDSVLVDVEVAAFLREVFTGYDRYFGHTVGTEDRFAGQSGFEDGPPVPGSPHPAFIEFTHLREDPAQDDRALIAVQVHAPPERADVERVQVEDAYKESSRPGGHDHAHVDLEEDLPELEPVDDEEDTLEVVPELSADDI